MVTDYKVIKDKGALKVGGIITLDGDMYKYFDEVSSDGVYSKMTVLLSPRIVDRYVKEGIVAPVTPGVDEPTCCECSKLSLLKEFLAALKNKYNQRKAHIEKKNKEGKILPCVKLEHDTVYFNLMKLINKIEEIINEQPCKESK